MHASKHRSTIKILPAILAALIDIMITIIHQPASYWNGDLSKANEGNPFGASLMANHVSGIFIISGIWLVIIWISGYYLPQKISRYILLFAIIAHSYGAGTWLSSRYGFWSVMFLIAFNTFTFFYAEDESKKRKIVA